MPGGCYPLLAKPVPTPDPSLINCRCSTAPWGKVATQKLFPSSTQVCYRASIVVIILM